LFRDWDNNGNPLAGGQLFSYVAGTSNPQATWTDSTQSQVNTNPVVLNSRGEASVWLDPTLTYKLVLKDSFGNQIWTADNIVGGYVPVTQIANYITQSYIGQTLFPQSAAEIAAGSLPTNYAIPYGDPRRFGAVGDGVTNDTAAMQTWLNVGGSMTLPALTFFVTAQLNLVSNTRITGTRGSILLSSVQDASSLYGTNVNNVVIQGIHVKGQAPFGTIGYSIGAICFANNSFSCSVLDCTIENPQWAGVTFYAASNCTVRGCYFTGFSNSIQDGADIALISSPSTGTAYCVVDGNFCFGGGAIGVSIQDPYNLIQCTRNTVNNNKIGQHKSYGILVYQPAGSDSYNELIDNHIEGILGNAFGNTSSGAGIYLANGVGGSVVSNNVIRNCCINTADTSLVPAGIGISGGGAMPISITGNVIEGMTQYWGILVTGLAEGCSIVGNTIRMPSSNTTGDGIRVSNCVGVTVSGNQVTDLRTSGTQSGIFVFAQGNPCSFVSVSNNIVVGGNGNGIRFDQSGGNRTTGINVVGNNVSGGTNAMVPLSVVAVDDGGITGNYFSGGTATVVSQSGATAIRYAANRLRGTGTVVLTTAGTCTSSAFDLSNVGTGAAGGVSNGATGFVVEAPGTAVPGAGTWAVGDMVRNISPTAAGVFMWICTTAGTPGTFKTISNT
jgi:hypothetical protein